MPARRHVLAIIFAASLIFSGTLPLFAADNPSQAGPGPVASGGDASPTQSAASLTGIYSLSATIPEDMLNLREKLASLPDPAALSQELEASAADIKKMQDEVAYAKSSEQMQSGHTQVYEGEMQRLAARLKTVTESVRQAVADLSKQRQTWLGRKTSLGGIQADSGAGPDIVQDEKKNLGVKIDQAIGLIDKSLSPYLDIGRRAGDAQAQLQEVQNDLRKIQEKTRAENISKRGDSVFSSGFYTRFNITLLKETQHSVSNFVIEQLDLLSQQGMRLLLVLLLVPLVAAIRWSKQFHDAAYWLAFANHPLATSIFLVSTGMLMLNKVSPDLSMSQEWGLILRIANILAVMRLLYGAGLHPDRRRTLSRLALFLAVAFLFIIVGLPRTLLFLYVFLVSALAACLYLRGLLPGMRDGSDKVSEAIRKSWGILPAIVLVAGLAGFNYFALFFFFIALSTIVSILMIWMLFRFHESLFELALSLIPVAAFRENRAIILKKSRPILLWAHGLLMLAVLTVVWRFYPNVGAAIAGVNDFGFTIGDLRLSPGFLVLVVLIFYSGLLVSETLQYVLVRGVLPRYTSEMGVRVSIARLAHYVIIALTFLVMLNVLGFKLAQLTIVGGALGVGIGFGLQAIVNNFASGLILLFERPIKVGDTIRFGSDTGEVKEVGLRATIIRTYDNAEVVVPNSMLITGQVTNWTLANRRARLKVPVGVAYGSDVAKVMEILLACANEHPGVLSEPKPTVLFMAFAASSLDFELRAWLPDYLHSAGILSELNVEIESRFNEAGIEMPFPQNDLHLRSMDEKMVRQLRGLQEKTTKDTNQE
ncbi:MAG: mechanosensitive ion channel [Desulfobulbaceae bacterium]|nr:mechanosensitive ion channel [Desulfobulbaceae bacterium]